MMDLIIPIVLLIIGFVFLIKGADLFVSGSSSIAALLKIPTIIVGLTIVALGTSAPEAAVSITASIGGNNAIAVSNVIGSNLFNILFIIGICALLKELKIGRDVLKRDFPFLLIVTIICTALILVGWNITQLDGCILLVLLVIYVFFLVYTAKKSKESQYVEKPRLTLPKSIIFIIIGLAGVVIGADFVVDNASIIAKSFGMSDTLIGLTIVAMGTSLPELVTSVAALNRNENQIVIGNVIGSNIFNIIFVLAFSSVISPITLDPSIFTDLCLMIATSILCYIFALTQDKFDRKEGIILILIFVAYMAFAIIRN